MPKEENQVEELSMMDQETDADIQQFVCFRLAKEEYAINIQLIQEAIKVPNITPVPQMPDFCLGVINSRGNVIPAFDLRKKFHLNEKEFDSNTRILVAAVDGVSISLIVDEVLDNIRLSARQIDPAPTVKMRIEGEYISGLGELDKRMIAILNLTKMHDFMKNEIGVTGE